MSGSEVVLARQRDGKAWGVALTVLLVAGALWLLLLSFFLPITPDTSVYLLHARTFANTLNRFALSHDSKGIGLMFLLTLPVRLWGATMAAGALAQAVAYGVTAASLIAVLHRYVSSRWMAVAVAALWMIAAFSPLMWGGRVRPEDFGVAMVAGALWGAQRGTRGGMVWCGVLAAWAFFTKSSLVLTPLAVGLAGGCLAAPSGRERITRVAWLAAGGLSMGALMLGWIVWMDDPAQWWRQTLVWPMQYKQAVGKSVLSWESVENLFALLQQARLHWLFVGCVAGLCVAWRRGVRRWVFLLSVLLCAEAARVVIEGEPWNYGVSIMVVPMVLGAALLGVRRDGRIGWRGVGAVWLLLLPVIIGTLPDAMQATRVRWMNGGRAPLEVLAERMRASYRPGEQIMVSGPDVQVVLHLNAPRPYPVLPLHLHAVSDDERAATLSHFNATPPQWIVRSDPTASPISFHCVGHPDRLTYQYVADEDGTRDRAHPGLRIGDRFPSDGPAQTLAEHLLRTFPYRLAVDTGMYQAWQLSRDG